MPSSAHMPFGKQHHTPGLPAPDYFTRRAGDAPMISATFRTNQKATQHILWTVPGGFPLIGIFATVSFVNLNGEVTLEADDIADMLRVGQKFTDCRACPSI
jgi:hypothetical protein